MKKSLKIALAFILCLSIGLMSIFFIERKNSSKTNIVILAAMQGEANCIIKSLHLHPDEQSSLKKELNADVFVSSNKKIRLIAFGKNKRFDVDNVGTQRAAVITWASIKAYHPNIILNTGTAGGIKETGAHVGDVYACTKAVYHDRRINLPKFKEYGIGNFPCYIPKGFEKIQLKYGILTTGNSLDASPVDLKQMKKLQASVVDMEGAAIAEIAQQNNVKYIGIKSVSDYVNNSSSEQQFLDNFALATKNLCVTSNEIIKLLTLSSQVRHPAT